jgi:proteasome lid subunit RPN8/RPN11
MAATSFVTDSQVEYSFVWNPGGHPGHIVSDHGADVNHTEIIKGYTQGIMHTHPRTKDCKPSPGDIALAKKAHIPVYVLSVGALYVVFPNGLVEFVANASWQHDHLSISTVQPQTVQQP